MLGIVAALVSALSRSSWELISKRNLKVMDVSLNILALRFVSFIVLVPLLFFIDIPHLTPMFWKIYAVSTPLDILVVILYTQAIKESEMSLVIPLTSLTPLFILLTEFVMFGTFPNKIGILGIMLIVLGVYSINLNKSQRSIFAPFLQVLKNKGARLVLIVTLIWSVTSVLNKAGVEHSSILFWTIMTTGVQAVFFFFVFMFKSKNRSSQVRASWKWIVLMGVFGALTILAQNMAFSLTFASYTIAIKRMSVLFTVLGGWFFFKEKDLKKRFFSSVLMVSGVLMIGFS